MRLGPMMLVALLGMFGSCSHSRERDVTLQSSLLLEKPRHYAMDMPSCHLDLSPARADYNRRRKVG